MKAILPILVILLVTFPVGVTAEAIDAQALYAGHCSVCHGDDGDGDSHAKQGMVPLPRDFTSPRAALELNRPRIVRAIREGIPGTAMSAWGSRLDPAQIEALADFVRTRLMAPEAIDPASEGGRIYAAYCSVCHGDRGQGALWATAGLSPRPADFTSAEFQAAVTRDHMIQSVTYGRPDTAMSGWGIRLTKRQIESVVDYVIAAFMPRLPAGREPAPAHPHSNGHAHLHADPDADLAAYLARPLDNGLTGDAARGEQLYRANCAACHGETGDGRGPRAYFINPKPRNFLHAASRASLNRPVLYQVIGKGKPRTEMPAWEKVLSAQQIADVGEFVFRRFIVP